MPVRQSHEVYSGLSSLSEFDRVFLNICGNLEVGSMVFSFGVPNNPNNWLVCRFVCRAHQPESVPVDRTQSPSFSQGEIVPTKAAQRSHHLSPFPPYKVASDLETVSGKNPDIVGASPRIQSLLKGSRRITFGQICVEIARRTRSAEN